MELEMNQVIGTTYSVMTVIHESLLNKSSVEK